MTASAMTMTAEEEEAGLRLDRFVHGRLPDLSRARCQDLIRKGHVARADGTIETPGYRVKPGDAFRAVLPEPGPAEPEGEDIPLDIVFEDDDLIVIDKPAGMVVHPAAGNWTGTLVNALIHHCGQTLSGIGGVRRPGIVHRLDKDTSGLLVVAKTDVAHRALAADFADHGRAGTLERAYLALIWGRPRRDRGKVDAMLARSSANRLKMAVVRQGGRQAITHYQAVDHFNDAAGKPVATLVRCTLETGRTHQIRVHMAHIGHPIMGDGAYGAHFAASMSRLSDGARQHLVGLERQALHAAILGFSHPKTGEALRFESPLPDDLAGLRAALKTGG